MTYNEMLKTVRAECKAHGLTFKRAKCTLNNAPAFTYNDRITGFVVSKLTTLNEAYNDVYSGYIMSYNTKTRSFNYKL